MLKPTSTKTPINYPQAKARLKLKTRGDSHPSVSMLTGGGGGRAGPSMMDPRMMDPWYMDYHQFQQQQQQQVCDLILVIDSQCYLPFLLVAIAYQSYHVIPHH